MLNAQQNIFKTTSVYSEDGKLQMLITYNPGCSCRTYTEFYPDGKILAKRVFKVTSKGEFVEGDDITFFHDGSIKQYKLWKNALPDGRAYANHDNGKLEHEEFYAGKYKAGSWKYFNKNGELIREHVFEANKSVWNSRKDSYTARYFDKGKLLYTEVYTEGKITRSDRKASVTSLVPAANPVANLVDGKKLFTLKCAACHAFGKDGYGPSLTGVTKIRSTAWLHRMISNGMKLVEEGDKDAVAIYKQYGSKKHLNMSYLSREQIQAIIDYLKKPD